MTSIVSEKLRQAAAAHDRRDWETAETLYHEILEQDPGHPVVCQRMAQMALQAGYPGDAVDWASLSLKSDGDNIAALTLRAKAHHALGKIAPATEDLQRAAKLAPANRGIQLELAQLLVGSRRAAEALNLFLAVADERPHPLTIAGTASAWQALGRMDECRKLIARQLELLPQDSIVRSQWIALHAGDPSVDAGAALKMASEWQQRFGTPADPLPPLKISQHRVKGPLRVGFVSTTFHHHANCNFLLPLLEALDPDQIQTFAYYDKRHRDAVTARCEKAVSQLRIITELTPRQAAEQIRADGIDILVDISGHYDGSRLRIFTYRPAPVQVHYLGGFGTTGLSSIGWRLADDLTEPPDAASTRYSSERIHRMAGGIHAYAPLVPAAEPNEPPCMSQPFITFGCLNTLSKIEPPLLRLWADLLNRIPNSRLLLVKDVFRYASNCDHFTKWAQQHGIDPAQLQLKYAEGSAHEDLSVYHSIDIALDTHPYNGITTTFEALWMGVPVVTLRGDRFVAREAAAILQRCGHPEWIATAPSEYIEIATSLSANRASLQKLRPSLRHDLQSSPLTDASRIAREFTHFCTDCVL